MRNRQKRGRWMAVIVAGGLMLQISGCLTGLVPIAQSVGESVALSLLVGAATP